MAWQETYFHALVDGIGDIWKRQQFTDVNLSVNGRTFRAHKTVLAALSPYFHAIFSSGIGLSKKDGSLNVPNIDADVFKNILSFMYTGKDVVTVDNAYSMYQAATMLQVRCLQVRCEELLCDQLKPENCISLWKNSKSYNSTALATRCWVLILQHFPHACRTEEFLSLNCDELISIIHDDNLNVENEEAVCDAVLRWLNVDLKKRRNYIGKIFEHLRLPLVSPEYLLNFCEKNSFISEDASCKAYIEEAKKYHMLPARRQDFTSKRGAYRHNSEMEDVLFVLTGGSSQPIPTSVTCFSLRDYKWYSLASLPYDPGVEFAACSYANHIFISGGSRKLQNLLKFDGERNDWQICEQMMQGRSRHAMIAVRDAIYVLGGHNRTLPGGGNVLCTIEKFTIGSGKWTTAGELPIPVEMLSAAAIAEKIYTFGGAVSSKKSTSAIQCFDTRVGTATYFADLPFSCRLTRAITCDNFVYIIATDGRVMLFNEESDCEKIGRMDDFYRLHFGAAQQRGNIIILGGKGNANKMHDDIMFYDVPAGKALTIEEKMPNGNVVDVCVKTCTKKEFLRCEYQDEEAIMNGK